MINFSKNVLLIIITICFICSMAGNVLAGGVASLTDKVDVQLYGQINRALLYADDGNDSYLYHVDNDVSGTRFGMKAKAKASEGLTVGAKFEVEIQSNASNNVNQNTPNEGGANFKERHMDVYIDFATAGKISIGQGDTASNGTSEVDLSGTQVGGTYSAPEAVAGGMFFYDKDNDVLSAVKVKDVVSNLDGNSRKDRLRYDTPKLSGFGFSLGTFAEKTQDPVTAVVKSKAAFDTALRYNAKFGDVTAVAAVAYSTYPSDHEKGKENLMNGSASLLFKGMSITLAGGNQSFDKNITGGKDSDSFFYGKLGYKATFWGMGKTALSIDYGAYNDLKAKDDEATTIGLALVQKLKAWSTELYASIRSYELKRPGSNFDNVRAFMIGTRIKF